MSIWGTFKKMQVHDSAHSEADPSNCGCGGDNEVYLSSAWFGFPVRLSIRDSEDSHAECALTREQARELGVELILWAAQDEAGEARMYPESYARRQNQKGGDHADIGRQVVEAIREYEGRGGSEPQPA